MGRLNAFWKWGTNILIEFQLHFDSSLQNLGFWRQEGNKSLIQFNVYFWFQIFPNSKIIRTPKLKKSASCMRNCIWIQWRIFSHLSLLCECVEKPSKWEKLFASVHVIIKLLAHTKAILSSISSSYTTIWAKSDDY